MMRAIILNILIFLPATIAQAHPLSWLVESVEEALPRAVKLIELSSQEVRENRWRLVAQGKSTNALLVADFLATLQAGANRRFKHGVCRQESARYHWRDGGHFSLTLECEYVLPASAEQEIPPTEQLLRALVYRGRSSHMALDSFRIADKKIQTKWRSLTEDPSGAITAFTALPVVRWTRLRWSTSAPDQHIFQQTSAPLLVELEGSL